MVHAAQAGLTIQVNEGDELIGELLVPIDEPVTMNKFTLTLQMLK